MKKIMFIITIMVIVIASFNHNWGIATSVTVIYLSVFGYWLMKAYRRSQEIKQLCWSLERNFSKIEIKPKRHQTHQRRLTELENSLARMQKSKDSSDKNIDEQIESEKQVYFKRNIEEINANITMLKSGMEQINKQNTWELIWLPRSVSLAYKKYKEENLLYHYKPSAIVMREIEDAGAWLYNNPLVTQKEISKMEFFENSLN